MNAIKRAVKAALGTGLLVLGLGLFSKAEAVANPDTMTISVTPTVTYSVSIASVTAGPGYQFGTIALGASTISTAAIVVTNNGTISEYFSLAVSNSTPDNWAPGASGTAANNTFGLLARLNNGGQPADAAFVGGDAVDNDIPAAAATLYGQASTKTAAAGTKNLWLKLNMPTGLTVGSGGEQTMIVSINGQAL